jgi:hypothetical protein
MWPGCVASGSPIHLAQEALTQLIAHLDAVDAQLAALDHRLDQVARTEPWSDPVPWLSERTAREAFAVGCHSPSRGSVSARPSTIQAMRAGW